MPRGDRTGPTGQGPLTGRGAGYCAGFRLPGFLNPVRGNRNYPVLARRRKGRFVCLGGIASGAYLAYRLFSNKNK